jgi:hypothetical protein
MMRYTPSILLDGPPGTLAKPLHSGKLSTLFSTILGVLVYLNPITSVLVTQHTQFPEVMDKFHETLPTGYIVVVKWVE